MRLAAMARCDGPFRSRAARCICSEAQHSGRDDLMDKRRRSSALPPTCGLDHSSDFGSVCLTPPIESLQGFPRAAPPPPPHLPKARTTRAKGKRPMSNTNCIPLCVYSTGICASWGTAGAKAWRCNRPPAPPRRLRCPAHPAQHKLRIPSPTACFPSLRVQQTPRIPEHLRLRQGQGR